MKMKITTILLMLSFVIATESATTNTPTTASAAAATTKTPSAAATTKAPTAATATTKAPTASATTKAPTAATATTKAPTASATTKAPTAATATTKAPTASATTKAPTAATATTKAPTASATTKAPTAATATTKAPTASATTKAPTASATTKAPTAATATTKAPTASATTKAPTAATATTKAPTASATTKAPTAAAATTKAPTASATTKAPTAATATTKAPTASATTKAPTAATATTKAPNSPTAATLPSKIPSSFKYSCDNAGDITIKKSELNSTVLKIIEPLSCNVNQNTSAYTISNCQKNQNITVLLETQAVASRNIWGGKEFKEFGLYCHEGPYTVNVTLNNNNTAIAVNKDPNYTSLSTVSPPKGHLTMAILDKKQNIVMTAILGQELNLKITGTGSDTLAPTECYASHGKFVQLLWSQAKCTADETLLGKKWINNTNEVSIVLYAFHFEGSSDVNIRCVVKVCPSGYEKQCDLTCGGAGAGKRRRRGVELINSDDVKVVDLKTNLQVYDTESSINKSNGLQTSFVLLVATVLTARWSMSR